jgi:DNA polymerase-3 subunit chi
MTDIAFHFNVPDKLVYACRFARKAQRSDSQLVIAADAETLEALDRMLWQIAPQDFVAHCVAGADEDLVRASPVFLATDAGSCMHHDVLLNLMGAVPYGFERFDRLVEVVSAVDQSDRLQARARWRHYESCGYAISSYDHDSKGG